MLEEDFKPKYLIDLKENFKDNIIKIAENFTREFKNSQNTTNILFKKIFVVLELSIKELIKEGNLVNIISNNEDIKTAMKYYEESEMIFRGYSSRSQSYAFPNLFYYINSHPTNENFEENMDIIMNNVERLGECLYQIVIYEMMELIMERATLGNDNLVNLFKTYKAPIYHLYNISKYDVKAFISYEKDSFAKERNAIDNKYYM